MMPYLSIAGEGWNPDITDFFDMAESYISAANESAAINGLDALIAESDVLLSCYEAQVLEFNYLALDTALEVGGVDIAANKARKIVEKNRKGFFSKLSGYIEKIINFFTDLIKRIADSFDNLISNDAEFIQQHAGMLKKIPDEILNNMTLTYIPYFNYGTEKLLDSNDPVPPNIENAMDKIGNDPGLANAANIFLDVYKKYFPAVYKYDKEDPKKGALLYYTNGKEPVTVQISDRNLIKGAVEGMVNFMQNEKQYVDKAKALSEDCSRQLERLQAKMAKLEKDQMMIKKRQEKHQGTIREADRTINKTSKELKQRATAVPKAESVEYVYGDDLYSIIEGCYLKDTELAILTNVSEDLNSVATGTSDPNAAKEDRVTVLNKQRATATANKEKAEKKLEKANADNKENEEARRTTDALIKMINIVTTIVSARPTVIKQVMTHYRSVLEKLVDGINKYNGVSERNAENKRYNKAQDDKAAQAHKERLTEIERNREAKRKKMSWFGKLVDTTIRSQ